MNDRKLIADIISKHLENSPYNYLINVNEDDIDFNLTNQFINWKMNVIGKHFKYSIKSEDKLADLLTKELKVERKNDRGTFYHFKDFKLAYKILKNRELQLSSLNSHIGNDSAEYTEFLQRYSNNPTTDIHSAINAKDEIFILCFTKHFRNNRFWKNYANDGSGICLGFQIEEVNYQLIDLFSFVDVIYDDGYNFDFINDIQRELYHYFNKYLFIGGLHVFAKFYKRKRYSWETETRLIFDFYENRKMQELFAGNSLLGGEKMPVIDLTTYLSPICENSRNYIALNFQNNFFKIKISEIIFGPKVSQEEKSKIISLVNNDVHCWQINESNN